MNHGMKTKVLYLFLLSITTVSYCQYSEWNLVFGKKDSVITPQYYLLDSNKDFPVDFFNGRDDERIAKPVTLGAEISGYYYFNDYPWIQSYGVSLALYAGQSFHFDKRYGGFTDYSPLYHTYNDDQSENRSGNTFMFFAPGISIFSKNRKYSLGLYQNLVTQPFVNGKQNIAAYKLNFHF
jgi:hypothetical protein